MPSFPPIATRRSRPARSPIEHAPPGELFRRGFYAGLGFWCAMLLINVALGLILLLILAALGILGAVAA